MPREQFPMNWYFLEEFIVSFKKSFLSIFLTDLKETLSDLTLIRNIYSSLRVREEMNFHRGSNSDIFR